MDKWTFSGTFLMSKYTNGYDNIGWGGTNTRNFTIQSDYDSQNSRAQSIKGDWKAFWSWKGPHIIQTFMCMAAHERLLTNYRKSKWVSHSIVYRHLSKGHPQ